jgi:hypothetical protein
MTRGTARAAGMARLLTALAAAALIVIAVPAVASANTAWVNNETPAKAPFNSCANPGFSAIQAAIGSPTTVIHVCKGTYEEQLQIERALTITGEAGVNVKLPAVPANSTTPCDAPEAQDLVAVCGKGVVKLSALTLEGRWTGAPNCAKEFFGVLVGGEADLVFTKSKILHAGAEPINGCQQGVAVQVGRNKTSQVGVATLTSDVIEGYQKNGITVDGPGSKATIGKTIISTVPQAGIAQNGIQVSTGAFGKITEATITGNECNLPSVCGENGLTQTQSTGVLFAEEAKGSTVSKSVINENDIGFYNYSVTEENKPQATITGNTMENDRFEGVELDQGFAAVNKNVIRKGNVGIQMIQYGSQTLGPRGTGTEDTIEAMKVFAIEGLSDSQPTDQFGSFTISNSKISGNPGATPATSVSTNNPAKLKIFLGAGNS